MRTRLTRLVPTIVVFALLAATGVVTASARGGSTELLVHFVLPGRDIECVMVDPNILSGNVTCARHRNKFRCSGPCDLENLSRHWSVDVTRPGLTGISRRGFGGSPAKILRPGKTLSVGYFRCSSREAGLTCVSRPSGHGFFLNNNKQRVF